MTWHRSLPAETRGRIEVRCYDVPAATVMLFDPAHPARGIAHVEPILNRVAPQDRPSFRVRNQENPILFTTISGCYLNMWHRATDINQLFTIDGTKLRHVQATHRLPTP